MINKIRITRKNTRKNARNRIEVQRTDSNEWQAKIWFDGKANYGFLPLPFTKLAVFSAIQEELQLINPEHSIIRV
jgi:hypothetical protein